MGGNQGGSIVEGSTEWKGECARVVEKGRFQG